MLNCSNLNVITILFLILLECGDIETNPGPTLITNLIFSHSNVRSLLAKRSDEKIAELQLMATGHKINVLSLSETWLNNSVPEKLLTLTGFQKPFLKNREIRSGGGVAVYCANHIPARRRHDIENTGNNIECIWLEILEQNKKILFGVYYRPPGQSAAQCDNFISALQTSIDRAHDGGATHIIITGDFNDTCKVWHDNHASSELRCKLRNFVNDKGLCQLINGPTRISTDGDGNLLDLIITDSPDKITYCDILSPISNCDHATIICKLSVASPLNKSFKRTVWNLKKANFEEFRHALQSAPWDTGIDMYDDIDDKLSYWYDLFALIMADYIPHNTVTVHVKEKPWVNCELKRLIRGRNVLWKRYKRTQQSTHYNCFKALRNRVTSLNRSLRKTYYQNLGEELCSSQISERQWWETVKKVTGASVQRSIPVLIEQDLPVSDPVQKANIFNSYFADQCTLPANAENHNLPDTNFETDQRLDTLNFQLSKKLLNSVDPSKASGPDNISNFVLKEVAREVCTPLCKIFNQSLIAGVYPNY